MTNHEEITSVGSYETHVELYGEALTHALESRRFEIELYWRRVAYFWTLIAASLAAFFLLMSADKPRQDPIVIVGCIGVTLSLAWYLANRGSKYWQENWERHIDVLEEALHRNLFKTTISPDLYPFWKLARGFPYSQSRLNQIISLYIVCVWVALAAWISFELIRADQMTLLLYTVVLIFVVFCIGLFCSSSSARNGKRIVHFRVTRLTESDQENAPNDPSPTNR